MEGTGPMKWHLRLAAAHRGIWKASELQRMLAERGVVISAGKMSGSGPRPHPHRGTAVPLRAPQPGRFVLAGHGGGVPPVVGQGRGGAPARMGGPADPACAAAPLRLPAPPRRDGPVRDPGAAGCTGAPGTSGTRTCALLHPSDVHRRPPENDSLRPKFAQPGTRSPRRARHRWSSPDTPNAQPPPRAGTRGLFPIRRETRPAGGSLERDTPPRTRGPACVRDPGGRAL